MSETSRSACKLDASNSETTQTDQSELHYTVYTVQIPLQVAKYHIYQFYISFCDCKNEYWFLRGPHLLHFAGFSRFVEELFVFFMLNENTLKLAYYSYF